MSVRFQVLMLSVLGAGLPACATEAQPPSRAVAPRATGIAPPTRIPDVIQQESKPAGEPVTTAAIPVEVRRAVVADAAKRFGVPESSVVLTGAEQVTWSDGSLGCPEPGRLYTQMLVPGFRMQAKTQEGQLTYHTDSHGYALTCGPTATTPANRIADKVPKGSEPGTTPPTPAPPKL
jgi:hypothetical protein